MGPSEQPSEVPRLETLEVHNYRALHDLELKGLTPLAVLLGPNGSGKSTVFDVFAFLSECFSEGLRKAWDRRGRFRELRTRGADGPIVIGLRYRERLRAPVITYHVEIEENASGPYLKRERLGWKRGQWGARFYFLDFQEGQGRVVEGETPDERAERVPEVLKSPEVLAVNTLGQLARHPRVVGLRSFITDWHLSYLSVAKLRGVPEAGPQERLSRTGDNLPNVMQYLKEQHPDRLAQILATLRERVPRLEDVHIDILANGNLILTLKDAPFDQPILDKYASDGTMKMLAYLTLLYDPRPPLLVGIEEPENYLHPSLLTGLGEECRAAASRTQLLVTTHSPFFVNALYPKEVWVLYRDDLGHTQARRTAEMKGVTDFVKEGALLGDLWMEGQFDSGYPLLAHGGLKPFVS